MPSPHRLALLLAVAFAGAWLVAAGAAVASARLPSAAGGWVLAIFPPGADGAARISEAEGLPLEPHGGGLAWTAYSPAAGFAGRLEERGALLVIRPFAALRLAGLCGTGMELLSGRRAEEAAGAP